MVLKVYYHSFFRVLREYFKFHFFKQTPLLIRRWLITPVKFAKMSPLAIEVKDK